LNQSLRPLFGSLTLATLFAVPLFAHAVDADPVVLTFSTVGDSRQDPVTFDPTTMDPVSLDTSVSPPALRGQDKIWLQNTKAWSRILRTVQSQKSNMLFFNGDMIHAYGWSGFGYKSNASGSTISGPTAPATVQDIVESDLVRTYQQYAFWRGMVAPAMETGTYIVPVPGNHEVQCKACGKVAKVENENAWRANMGDLILDSKRFQAVVGTAPTHVNTGDNRDAGLGMTSDQSQLSYSFDVGDSHFAVVNTDPVGADNKAPAGWLASDLAAASSRGAKHFFVFGHKPAYTYFFGTNTPPNPGIAGLDKFIANRDAFWTVIEQYGATYFCGHEHVFNISQPKGSAYQVLVGSGGSPFDAKAGEVTLGATDRTYAWVTAKVRRSGKVELTAYGFNEAYGPTQVLKQVTLAH